MSLLSSSSSFSSALSSLPEMDGWLSQSCSLHISVHLSPFAIQTFRQCALLWTGAGQLIKDGFRCWLTLHPIYYQLLSSFFPLNLPPSANRAWHLRILLHTSFPYSCLVVGSLCVFLQAVPPFFAQNRLYLR